MRVRRYSSFVLMILLMAGTIILVPGQAPKNVAYRAKAGTSMARQASVENIALKENLNWIFGGKSQRGWYLYWPLISQFLQFTGSAESEAFAGSVLRWQQRSQLAASGVLEQETLMKMVEYWQARRSKDRSIPTANQLFTVRSQDFYDPERPLELRQVEMATYAAYKKMVAAAAKDLGLATDGRGNLAAEEKYLKIISAFRSPEYQQKLRAQSPNSGRAGLAVNSPHFTGRALDLYVGGEPVSTKDGNRALQTNTKAYRWLVKNAERFGFIPYFYEPWHWEYNPQGTSLTK